MKTVFPLVGLSWTEGEVENVRPARREREGEGRRGKEGEGEGRRGREGEGGGRKGKERVGGGRRGKERRTCVCVLQGRVSERRDEEVREREREEYIAGLLTYL